ncbi:MAG TPA: hypothetical protein VMF30_19460 [Pirellulales bacterium]|nr:hypothetical protein [Pirellulales bacterium]
MGTQKGPSEGGSGGKRGHSNMEHWDYSDDVKAAAKRRRRLDDKKAVRDQSDDGEIVKKRRVILDRIKHLEDAITKGRAYLESGKHAHWQGFRPLFAAKAIGGKTLPPHKDWVKNVFLPGCESALRQTEKVLAKLT